MADDVAVEMRLKSQTDVDNDEFDDGGNIPNRNDNGNVFALFFV